MDKVEQAILLFDAKEPQSVRHVQMLIDSSSELVLEYLNDVVHNASGDWDVLLHPWDMLDDQDLDQ